MDLLASLARAAGSAAGATREVESTAEELGLVPDPSNVNLVALALCRAGRSPESISGHLDWREFEKFCSSLFRAWGYAVRENVRLKRPRAQIDFLAAGDSVILSVDCKHWQRGHSASVLRKLALDQLRRSELLGRQLRDSRPIVSVILSLAEPEGKFVEGVAVVPVRTLRSFLGSLEAYTDHLELR